MGVGKIVTLTMNPALDVSTDVDRVTPGEKLRCGPTVLDPGGGGINVSRVVHRLGGQTEAIYLAGGIIGASYAELVAAEGFPAHRVAIVGTTRESFTVSETSTGEQYRFVLTGPSLTDGEVTSAIEAVTSRVAEGDWLVASGSLPPGVPLDFYGDLADTLRALGVKVVVDTVEPWLSPAAGRGLFLLKPSRHEVEDFLGEALPTLADQVRGAREMRQRTGAWQVAMSLGSEGAVLDTAEGTWRATVPRVDAVSTVGAGDSFLGGLLVGFQAGESAERALARAVAAGTATAMTPATKLCDPAEVERLLGLVETSTLEQ